MPRFFDVCWLFSLKFTKDDKLLKTGTIILLRTYPEVFCSMTRNWCKENLKNK